MAPASADGGWVVMTAGHCAWDDGDDGDGFLAVNWVFVPNYEDVLEFGCSTGDDRCYVAASLHPASLWMAPGDDYQHDVAFAKMAAPVPQALTGVSLPVVTLDSAIGHSLTAFGYPAAKKYSGSDLIYCAGTATNGPSIYSENAQLRCDMTGGSSGGPWYTGPEGSRLAVSLNSFGLRGFNGYMFGPEFDRDAIDALILAS